MSASSQLKAEIDRRKRAEQETQDTRRKLQLEIERVWGLVPGYRLDLMGVYPPLRQLFAVLVDAARLQDPSRGSPIEDTMRTDFIHTGPHASTSSTERAVSTHAAHRHNVSEINKQISYLAHRLAKLVGGEEWGFDPPDGECAECGNPIVQSDTGRPRTYCSTKCRQRAATKRDETSSAGIHR